VVVAEIADDLPSGSGFLPDGTPILVLRRARQVVKATHEGLQPYADLGPEENYSLNDMVVDTIGRAYVGNIVRGSGDPTDECVYLIDTDGSARIATSDVRSPNGMVIAADGKSLTVAETIHHSLASFDIAADGSLSNRRTLTDEIEGRPDGICGDAEGGTWVGCVHTSEFLRIASDGSVADRILVGDRLALACVLGGPTRRTLFMMTASTTIDNVIHNEARGSKGFIEIAEVDVPGAGIP
jgi:sugar lactone lactonase YvrE